jgi:hypothetical protein
MTPWEKTLVAAKATMRIADEYCILKMWRVKWKIEKCELKIVT